MWQIIVTEFDRKGCMVQVDLCCHMMEKCMSETDDICAHLDDMALSYERLSGMGVAIHDEDYASMVLMSLPNSYTTHLETLTDATISSRCTFTTQDFISKAIELLDKQQLWANHNLKSGQENSTFQSLESHSKGKKNNSPQKDIEYFNCHKKGHFACDCHGPRGAKEGQQPPRRHPAKANNNATNATASVQNSTWSTI